MTMLANRTEGRVLTLADYEARIYLYKEQIGTGYIGIGRTLLEAKEAQVVPFGEWETWVKETTGLSPRQAQRCMQAATEIKDGSSLARLEMSKALLLLSSGLDEEVREEIAEKAADEGATVKALQEEIRQAKLKLVQETGAATEMRIQLNRAKAERDGLANQMKAQIHAYQQRMDEEADKAYRRGMDDMSAQLEKANQKVKRLQERLVNVKEELWDEVQNEFETKLDKVNAQNADLNDRLRDARKEAEEEVAEELNALKRNQDDLLTAAAEAEKRAADAEAELEALRAGGGQDGKTVADKVSDSVYGFLSICGYMTDRPEVLQRLDARSARNVLCSVDILQSWCESVYEILDGAVKVEGAVE